MKRKIAAATAAILLTSLIVYLAETRNGFFDSKVYYGAIQYWFHGDGGMVYDWLRPGSPYGFTYPPFAGLLMSPMAVLPFAAVVVLATVGTVVSTVLLVRWLGGEQLRRYGWFGLVIAACLAVVFEPVRETITFGQVNTLLLALVTADMLFGVARGRPWAGIGIGLAVAVKLTPGVFILYLLITRRWRAAATAAGSATAATLLAAAVFPDESREFWTSALWDTNRVGVLSYLSNQSERGFLARLPIPSFEAKVWIVGVLLTLAFWAWRVRREPDDVLGGLGLTGIVGCLISPVTWIHHCVWLLPAMILCLRTGNPRIKFFGAFVYAVTTSHLAWLWEKRPRPPLELIGANLYVWLALALLIWTPLGTRRPSEVTEKDRVVL
jgi:alpha-1,2-mannosyltransferase